MPLTCCRRGDGGCSSSPPHSWHFTDSLRSVRKLFLSHPWRRAGMSRGWVRAEAIFSLPEVSGLHTKTFLWGGGGGADKKCINLEWCRSQDWRKPGCSPGLLALPGKVKQLHALLHTCCLAGCSDLPPQLQTPAATRGDVHGSSPLPNPAKGRSFHAEKVEMKMLNCISMDA